MTTNIYDMADAWNNAGTTFTAIKMNVTDTASAAGSLLMDLQVGGSSKFSVSKSGVLDLGGSISMSGATVLSRTGNNTVMYGGGNLIANVSASGYIALANGGHYGWSSSGSPLGALDTKMHRDSAGVIGQHNGASPQTFNIYNSRTDASNYERGFLKWNSNVLEIGAEAAGTGTVRALRFPNAAISMANLPTADPVVAGRLWNDAGTLKVSTGS